MDLVIFKLLNKKQQLRDLYLKIVTESPVNLSKFKQIKTEMEFCEYLLNEVYSQKSKFITK